MRLIRKTKAFLSEINANQENIARSTNEEASMAQRRKDLQEEISEIYNNVKRFRESEEKKKNDIAVIEASVEELKFQISAGSGWTPEQEHEMNQLKDERDGIRDRLENTNRVYSNLRMVCDDKMNEITLITKENDDLENLIELTRVDIQSYKKDCDKEVNIRKGYDNSLKDMRNKMEDQTNVIKEKQKEHQQNDKELKELDNIINELDNSINYKNGENDKLFLEYREKTKEV